MKFKVIAAFALVSVVQATQADVWNCTNRDIEVQCSETSCENSDVFTPLSVLVDSVNGSMSVCAYSTCYDGKGVVVKNGSHLIFSGHTLASSSDATDIENVMLGINSESKVAVINGLSFASPMLCSLVNSE